MKFLTIFWSYKMKILKSQLKEVIREVLKEAKSPKFKDKNISDYVEEAATSGPEFENYYYDDSSWSDKYEGVEFYELSKSQKKSVVKGYLTDRNGFLKNWKSLGGDVVKISGSDLTKAVEFVVYEIGTRVS